MVDRVPQARERIAAAQRHVVAAVAAGDRELAETWMRRHIRDFRRGYELSGISLETPAA
jgi:DNA-binding GntR family transcriptional regulator